MSFRGAGLIGLVLVLCVGAILRLHDLTGQSFWLDEACSVAIAQSPLDSLVQQTAADVHPPLYYLLLHYWMLATDRSEFSVRLFSVVIGLAGIAAVFFVTRRLFTPATALIAAAILAALPFHIHHSQEARMYGLLALLATLSMHGFLATLGPQPSRRAIAGYLAASAAMLYTHAYGFFVLAAQLAYIGSLIVNAPSAVRPALRRYIAAQVVLGLVFLPWALVMADQVMRVEQGFWIMRWPAWLLPYTIVVQSGSWWIAGVLAPLAAVPVMLTWAAAIRADAPPDAPASSDHRRIVLLIFWAACPVLLPFAISLAGSPIFLPKYTLPSAIAFVVLAAHGLTRLRPTLRYAAAAALIGTLGAGTLAYYGKTRNDRWRDAVSAFDRAAQTHDLVLFSQPWGRVPFDYYTTRVDVIERQLPPNLAQLPRSTLAAVLEATAFDHERVWFVISQSPPALSLLREQLGTRYALISDTRVRGVQMYLFERQAHEGAEAHEGTSQIASRGLR